MIAVDGIYENGEVRLNKQIHSKKSIKVIVTFLEDDIQEDTDRLSNNDFSFNQARQKTSNYKGNLSDAIIEDRRIEL